jgi:quercetin dioxygenase-like cupin family protein
MVVNRWDDPERIDTLDGGGERRVLGSTDEMLLVHYSLEEGEVGPPHSHDETTVEAGDSYVLSPGTTHGVRALESCRVIDAFSPPLEAYRPD